MNKLIWGLGRGWGGGIKKEIIRDMLWAGYCLHKLDDILTIYKFLRGLYLDR